MKMKNINLHFSHQASNFGHLTPEFQIFIHGLCFSFCFFFLPLALLEEGHFSRQLPEPRDIK